MSEEETEGEARAADDTNAVGVRGEEEVNDMRVGGEEEDVNDVSEEGEEEVLEMGVIE